MDRKINAKIKWPKVSFILLTLNDVKGTEKCLRSVKMQDYPKGLIDIVVVDNGSTDGSEKVAKKMGARVFSQPKGTLYSNWIYGMHRVKGEYFFYLEQDIELRDKSFIKKMIKPMLEDKRIIASFTKEHPNKEMHWTARFLSYHHAQADPLLELVFDKLEKKFVSKADGYMLCKFDERLQPAVRMFYRVRHLKKTPNWKAENYFDHDFAIRCVRAGYPYFAYVPEPGYYHYHVKNFKHFLQKRIRNMHLHYFDYHDKGSYVILNIKDKRSVIKLIAFFIYANLLFPATIRGILRFIKHRDPVLLTEPIITIGVADALLFAFLTDKRGRTYISNSLKTLISPRTAV